MIENQIVQMDGWMYERITLQFSRGIDDGRLDDLSGYWTHAQPLRKAWTDLLEYWKFTVLQTCTQTMRQIHMKCKPSLVKNECTFNVQYKPNNSKRRPHLLTWRAVRVSDIRACLCPVRKQEVTLEPLACSLAWETNYYKSVYKLIHNPEIQW